MKERTENVLNELKTGLRKICGDNLKNLFLYGSYARGEEKAGSDIDVLVVLSDFNSIWEEIQRMNACVSDICLKYGVAISLIPMKEVKYNTVKTPLILNVKKEGVALL